MSTSFQKRLAEMADPAPAAEILPIPVPDPDSTLVFCGGEVKALGGGKVGGMLIRYGSADEPDVQGDFFHPGTEFGIKASNRIHIFYHHCLPRRGDALSSEIGQRPVGIGEVKARPDGLAIEGKLDLSRPAVARLYADIEAGRMGWSSGSADRQVIRTPVKAGVHRIDQWILNDATLSPTPVDPRNRAVCLKALIEGTPEDAAVPAPSFVDRSARLVSDLGELCEIARGFAKLGPSKQAAIKAMIGAVAAFEPLKIDLQRLLRPDPEAIRLFRLAMERDAL